MHILTEFYLVNFRLSLWPVQNLVNLSSIIWHLKFYVTSKFNVFLVYLT